MRLGGEKQVLMGPLACWHLFPHLNKGNITHLTCARGRPWGSAPGS